MYEEYLVRCNTAIEGAKPIIANYRSTWDKATNIILHILLLPLNILSLGIFAYCKPWLLQADSVKKLDSFSKYINNIDKTSSIASLATFFANTNIATNTENTASPTDTKTTDIKNQLQQPQDQTNYPSNSNIIADKEIENKIEVIFTDISQLKNKYNEKNLEKLNNLINNIADLKKDMLQKKNYKEILGVLDVSLHNLTKDIPADTSDLSAFIESVKTIENNINLIERSLDTPKITMK